MDSIEIQQMKAQAREEKARKKVDAFCSSIVENTDYYSNWCPCCPCIASICVWEVRKCSRIECGNSSSVHAASEDVSDVCETEQVIAKIWGT